MKQRSPISFPLDIFYDGSCYVCDTEMGRYRKHAGDDRLRFIDISAENFDASEHGRDRDQLMKALHVRDGAGRFHTGVDAFTLLWRALPSPSVFRLLAAVVSAPGIRQVAQAGYALFATSRHLLPRKHRTDRCSVPGAPSDDDHPSPPRPLSE